MIYQQEKIELLRLESQRLYAQMNAAIIEGQSFESVKNVFRQLKYISKELREEIRFRIIPAGRYDL